MQREIRGRAIAVQRPDLRPAEGILAGTLMSLMLWAALLLFLH